MLLLILKVLHQVPMAVFLCGVNTVGTLGLAAARHLASHGVSRSDCFPDRVAFKWMLNR